MIDAPIFPPEKTTFRNFPYFVLMRAAWRYAGVHRRPYLLALFLMSCSMGVWLLEPYLIGRLFNELQHGLGSKEQLYKTLFIVLLIFLLEPVGMAVHAPGRIIERQTSYFVTQAFVQDMYGKLQNIPYAWHQNFHSGQVFDRIRKAETALDNFTGSQYRYLSLMGNFIGPIIALMFSFPLFGLACILFMAVSAWISAKFDRNLIALYGQANRLAHVYAGIFNDYMANIRTIITLHLGKLTETELLSRYRLQQPVLWRQYRINQGKWSFISVSSGFFTSSLIAIAIYGVYRGGDAIQIGSLVMLIQYLGRFSNVFYNVGELYQEVVKAATDYKSAGIIDEAYAGRIAISNQYDASVKDWQHLRIEGVSFAYKDAENKPHTLKDVSFDVARGEKIALIGLSGSGKSTLMTLLRGLYQADTGRVRLDGRELPFNALTAITTLIPQDPEIFENTIRYNITFGVEHSDDEIVEVCRMAGFDQVLEQLPKGLDTDIREKGVNLSGGQKQRLALTRGIFAIRESSFILMDEPTSSVDTVTEIKIFERLFAEFPDKAMIASIHRLHLLPRFDRVVVMADGCIVEQGTMQNLLQQGGALANIWQEYQDGQKLDAIGEF